MREALRLAGELVKLRVSAAATLSAFAAYAAAGSGSGRRAAALLVGVFLTACGACALNEYLEREPDGLMRRTKGRPIPSGRISPLAAAGAAAVLLAAGGAALLRIVGAVSLLGAAAVAWYDGVYTPLKKATPFAVVPGALVGAAPPAIGWLAGGGGLWDMRLLALCFFFFIWQVPHFWLLVSANGDDWKRGGFPTMDGVLGEASSRRLVFVWMGIAAASCLLLPVFGVVGAGMTLVFLSTGAAGLLWRASRLLLGAKAWAAADGAFRDLNAFALLVMALVWLDPFL